MRPVIAKKELESFIPTLPKLPVLEDVPSDGKLAAAYYRDILSAHNCRELLRLCKTLYAKQTALAKNRKSVNATDLRNWKTAEDMVYGEFGFVLGMPPTDVKTFLIRALA
jgi:RNA polymerase-interacting CarD/CdnL/TRCF family regulator